MRAANPGEIEAIHAHLRAGHEIAICTYGRTQVLNAKCVDYIRADGTGYRLGWPGKRSVFAFAHLVRFVPADHTLLTKRSRERA